MDNPLQLAAMFETLDFEEDRRQAHIASLEAAEVTNTQNEIRKGQEILARYGLEFLFLSYLTHMSGHFTRRGRGGGGGHLRTSQPGVDGVNLIGLNRNWREILGEKRSILKTILTEIERFDRSALSYRLHNERQVAVEQYRAFKQNSILPKNMNPLLRHYLKPNQLYGAYMNIPRERTGRGTQEDRWGMKLDRPYFELYSELRQRYRPEGELVNRMLISGSPQITVSGISHNQPWHELFEMIIFEIMSPRDRQEFFNVIKNISINYYKTKDPMANEGDGEEIDIEFNATRGALLGASARLAARRRARRHVLGADLGRRLLRAAL